MKILAFLALLFSASNNLYAQELKKISAGDINSTISIPLLKANMSFKPEILDRVTLNNSNELILLNIKYFAKDDHSEYELTVSKYTKAELRFLIMDNDHYTGYFKYKNHIVLVYGAEQPDYFFSNTNIKKRFDFIPLKPYDLKNNLPISIENEAYVYKFSKGEFTLIGKGMFQ